MLLNVSDFSMLIFKVFTANSLNFFIGIKVSLKKKKTFSIELVLIFFFINLICKKKNIYWFSCLKNKS